jgi:hypothetical protein
MHSEDDQLGRFRDAHRQAAGVYARTPGTHMDRLDAVLAAHLAALAGLGLLTGTPPGTAVPDPEEDARWLASRSGHPRFADGDGWQRLLTSEVDIEMAYRVAVERHGSGPARHAGHENAARDRLLRHLTAACGDAGHVQ